MDKLVRVEYIDWDGLRLPVLFFTSTELTDDPAVGDNGYLAAEGAAD